MAIQMPAGDHCVEIRFEDTPLRCVSALISLASLLGLLAASCLARRIPLAAARADSLAGDARLPLWCWAVLLVVSRQECWTTATRGSG